MSPSRPNFVSDADPEAAVAPQPDPAPEAPEPQLTAPAPENAAEEVVEAEPTVVLVPTDQVEEYPVTVHVPGYEAVTFESEGDSHEVPAFVRDHIAACTVVAVKEDEV